MSECAKCGEPERYAKGMCQACYYKNLVQRQADEAGFVELWTHSTDPETKRFADVLRRKHADWWERKVAQVSD